MLARSPGVAAIALNVSGRSLNEPTLPRFIIDALRIAGVAPWYQARTLLPVLGKVTATRYVDRVHVRLVSGQAPAERVEHPARGAGAREGRDEDRVSHPAQYRVGRPDVGVLAHPFTAAPVTWWASRPACTGWRTALLRP